MKQVVQSVGDGSLRVVEVPTPTCGPAEVLVSTTRSLLSSGTEKAVRELPSASLLNTAKPGPDLVRQVLKKARSEVGCNTMQAVRTRLDDDMPLGYSAPGVVLGAGPSAHDLVPGTPVTKAPAGPAEAQVIRSPLAS